MNLAKAVENIGTVTELRRIASAYVIDYRNLSEDEIKAALIKTGPQYYFKENLLMALRELSLSDNRDHRTLSCLMLKDILLHKDNFLCPKRETEDEIIALEQAVVNRSNEDLLRRSSERSRSIELFQFVVETAWQYNDSISPDEKNLIEKIKGRLKITDTEYRIIEAKLGQYPKAGNELHTRGEIEEVRRLMQTKGLIFSIRDNDNSDFDLVPDEVANTLRQIWNIQIRQHGYKELLKSKYVRSKKYLAAILSKCHIPSEGTTTLQALQDMFLEQVSPTILLGGVSPNDGLDKGTLSKWCAELKLNVSGAKAELIERIIDHYDNILVKDESIGDEREHWYKHYCEFASRSLEFLHSQQLIQKDLECERKFEEATNYLFEKRLLHKPLNLIGTAHPDGALSFQDKVIFWDNKSKETAVNLKEHIRQFDAYIKSSERKVACFLVIGPDFTAESSILAMQYQVENGTTITLITAEEIQRIAEEWSCKNVEKREDPFPLGYLIQPGRFNEALLAAI